MKTNELIQALKEASAKLDWRLWIILLLALVSLPVYHAVRWGTKPDLPQALANSLKSGHRTVVAVAKVEREDLAEELVCEAELRPYQEIDLHTKVAGYLETITVDIGDEVKAGQLLATIEIPELQDDINAAAAAQTHSEQEVARADAAYEEAHMGFDRLSAASKAQPNLFAQQDLDAAQAKDRATSSALAAARAEVEVTRAQMSKLQTMLKYSRVTAPFSGVITKRYADPGALIQAGTSSSTQTLPLVRLSQNDRLRLDIPVSVSYVSRIKTCEPVDIRVDSTEQLLTGTIARTTRKVETATRTMEVEVDVPNHDLKLIPGMYASAILRLDRRQRALTIPVTAVSRAKGCTVFLVDKENKVEERAVKLGLETPKKIEILGGLSESDLVLVGSRARLKPGELVEPKLVEEAKVTE